MHWPRTDVLQVISLPTGNACAWPHLPNDKTSTLLILAYIGLKLMRISALKACLLMQASAPVQNQRIASFGNPHPRNIPLMRMALSCLLQKVASKQEQYETCISIAEPVFRHTIQYCLILRFLSAVFASAPTGEPARPARSSTRRGWHDPGEPRCRRPGWWAPCRLATGAGLR